MIPHNLALDTLATILTYSLLAVFYLANPDYLKESKWLRDRVKQRTKQTIKEELLSYSKKHLD